MSDYDPPSSVGLGTRLWIRDRDHTYGYSRDSDSLERFASRWREHEIVGETRMSWIMRGVGAFSDRFDKKLSKKSLALAGRRIRWSLDGIAAEYAEALWAQKNRFRIHDAVLRIDVPTLRKVAALIGYEAAK